MTDHRSWIARVRSVRPPDYWDEAVRRVPFAGPTREARLGRGPSFLLVVASLLVVGVALFALRGLVGGQQRSGNGQPADAPERHVETDWFVAGLPDGWSAVVPTGQHLGEGVIAAQLTNFGVEELVCIGGGEALPSDGVVVRLTIGSEQGWERSLVLPEMDPALADPVGPGTFIDDCGAEQKLFGMFFGPDGHQMTAHVLLGFEATTADRETASAIVSSLEPTGHEPAPEPPVWRVFADGHDPVIGRWLMTFQPASGGRDDGIFFFSKDWTIGIPIDDGARNALTNGISSGPEGQLLVIGSAPAEAADIVLEVEGAAAQKGTLVPLPRELSQLDLVAFFVGPFSGRLGVEGTELTPNATLVALDQGGDELLRQRLPE